MKKIENFIVLLYLFYFVVLFALILAQVNEIHRNYTNWGTAVVTVSHFCVGGIEVLVSSQTIQQKIQRRYIYWYNIAADILTGGALITSVIFLSVYWNTQTTVTAFLPIAIAIVGNIGCAYGRARKPPQTDINAEDYENLLY